ncbi:MAG: class I SAM-dependent methyltransferase, partial [Spirochaetaceae bacterium]|nr:class I SAM-dependent methyltransferase [Spirochaetaceae bacterium]
DRLALRRLLPERGGKIADVCGGFGRLAAEYIDRYAEAYLIDYAPSLLEQAQAEYGSRLRIAQGSVYAMPFDAGEFDAVIMVRAAHHLTDLNAAVAELARILKSGGLAVIEIANKCGLFEIARRCCGRSALRPFSLEPESRGKAIFFYFHPRCVERIFEQNHLRVKKTLAVSGLRRHVSQKFACAPLLYALEYLLQYTIGFFKWSPSLYYLLVRE